MLKCAKKEEPTVEEPKVEEPKKEESKKEESKKEEPKKEEPKKEEPKKEEPKVEENKFKNDNGILTYLDTENSPFDGLGVKIIINNANNTAKFIKTDLAGNEGVDYYTFNFKDNTFEKYYFVSAMGNGYYYYYDLTNKVLTKVEDKERKDSTQSMKDADRWDNAVKNTEADIAILQDYFNKEYKTSIKDFVK